MTTPADQRLLELLDRWLASLELHSQYCSLDDDCYSKIQSWPRHQRPSRWIVDLAKDKALTLRSQIQERVGVDATFCESLELMAFLTNLLGSEYIERFIPLAEPAGEGATNLAQTDEPQVRPDSVTGTREMPAFEASTPRPPAPAGTATGVRIERRAAETAPAVQSNILRPVSYSRTQPSEAAHEVVIADAARLVQWGRKWYELAELISSMADRPHLTDVRRILKDNKEVIEKKAGRGSS